MDIVGKPTIHPLLFFSGKILGYLLWIIFLLSLLKINLVNSICCCYNNYIALALVATGTIFVTASLVNLGRSTRLGLPATTTVFKTHGIYKISRNPMYLGFNLLTLAAVIYMVNIPLTIMGIYSIIIYHLIIRGEERFLENRFGNDYLAYKKRFRRYL